MDGLTDGLKVGLTDGWVGAEHPEDRLELLLFRHHAERCFWLGKNTAKIGHLCNFYSKVICFECCLRKYFYFSFLNLAY